MRVRGAEEGWRGRRGRRGQDYQRPLHKGTVSGFAPALPLSARTHGTNGCPVCYPGRHPMSYGPGSRDIPPSAHPLRRNLRKWGGGGWRGCPGTRNGWADSGIHPGSRTDCTCTPTRSCFVCSTAPRKRRPSVRRQLLYRQHQAYPFASYTHPDLPEAHQRRLRPAWRQISTYRKSMTRWSRWPARPAA